MPYRRSIQFRRCSHSAPRGNTRSGSNHARRHQDWNRIQCVPELLFSHGLSQRASRRLTLSDKITSKQKYTSKGGKWRRCSCEFWNQAGGKTVSSKGSKGRERCWPEDLQCCSRDRSPDCSFCSPLLVFRSPRRTIPTTLRLRIRNSRASCARRTAQRFLVRRCALLTPPLERRGLRGPMRMEATNFPRFLQAITASRSPSLVLRPPARKSTCLPEPRLRSI